MTRSTERWSRIQELLDEALDRAPAVRAGYLDSACAGDRELYEEVARLLRACARAGDFLERPPATLAEPLLDELFPGAAPEGIRIGPYRTTGELGRGGMAIVYLAERDDAQFRQRVALKLVPRGLNTPGAIRRFIEERRILAELEHANIARLLDGGVTEDGLPYFAMERVEGTPIDRWCEDRDLPVAQRLELFAAVCDAVAYAHRKRVVHRDLKPSNILITEAGEPKLLDFGIAKLLAPDPEGADGLDGAALTLTGVRPMTPEYASPEQVRGAVISTASDVYSLGVLLYRLLTGSGPYSVGRGSRHEIERMILEAEPPKPSNVAPDRVRRQLKGDLDTVILTAMRKQPAGRYPSAEELGSDVRRHLQGFPVGARPDSRVYRARKFTRRNRSRIAAAGLVAVSLVVGIAGTVWLLDPAGGSVPRPTPSATAAAPHTIAVLPFENVRPGEQNLSFADVMTEDVTSNLAGIEGLRVIARTSVMQYRNSEKPVSEIGRELDVDYLLEGSIRRAGDQVRITAELINASSGVALWNESYDRRIEDIFAVQSEIAQMIARELGAEVAPDVQRRIERAPTDDLVAYNLYLRGRFYWHRRTEAGLRESARSFERAVQRDSGYARAWAGLADAYSVLAFYDYLPPNTAYPRAKEAASRALEIDPELAEAHASLGYIALYYDWDWVGAEEEFRRSIALNPNYSVAHQWYANYLVAMGRFAEAADEMRRAREVNPLSLIANGALGWVFFISGRYEDAVRQCDLALEMDPDWDLGYLWRGQALEELRREADAIASLRTAVRLSDSSGISLAALAHAYATFDARESALEILNGLLANDRYHPSYEIAKVYLALGDEQRAMDWLERAYSEHAHSMAFLLVDPQLVALHSNPGFMRLAARVGLT